MGTFNRSFENSSIFVLVYSHELARYQNLLAVKPFETYPIVHLFISRRKEFVDDIHLIKKFLH